MSSSSAPPDPLLPTAPRPLLPRQPPSNADAPPAAPPSPIVIVRLPPTPIPSPSPSPSRPRGPVTVYKTGSSLVATNAVNPTPKRRPPLPHRFACPTCPRQFPTQSKLNRHALIHAGVRPHSCAVCGQGFPDSANCRRHERACRKREDSRKEVERVIGQLSWPLWLDGREDAVDADEDAESRAVATKAAVTINRWLLRSTYAADDGG